MGSFLNLQSLIIHNISLGYIIEFSTFGSSLNLNISKKINNNDINEYIVRQTVPIDYLYDISKFENLVIFMTNKLDQILEQKNINYYGKNIRSKS